MTDNKTVYYDNLTVSSSPHLVTTLDTNRTMMWVLIALCPSIISSVVYFGPRALLLTAICVAACVFFEWGYEKLLKKPVTTGDLSACVTGVILALNLPAGFPFWMAIIGCFTAIVVVKMLFGGIGRNFANPAIVGRIVLLLSFTSYMTTWPRTNFQADTVSSATPLALLSDKTLSGAPSLGQMFMGNIGGAMGETCTLAILIGLVILIAKKIISPIIPCYFIGTVFVFSLIYYAVTGGMDGHGALYMAVYNILAGGVFFGATFCATDYVTSPIMKRAKILYAIGCGIFTMIIRLFASYPEGVSFAILFMNVLSPSLDLIVEKQFYGYGKKAKKKAEKA